MTRERTRGGSDEIEACAQRPKQRASGAAQSEKRRLRFGAALKGWLERILGRIFLRASRRSAVGERAGGAPWPRRILVVRIDERVGNVVLTVPVVLALAEAFASAEVDWLVSASKVSLLDGPFRVLAFGRRDWLVHPFRLGWLLWGLRRRRYDVAVDASHWHRPSLTSALIVAWSGAAMRIGHAGLRGVGYHTHRIEPPVAEEPEVKTKMRLLEPLGIRCPATVDIRLKIGMREPEASRMRTWLRGQGLEVGAFAAVYPGGRKADHRVPSDVFVSLIRFLQERGVAALVLWGPGEGDLARAVAAEVDGSLCAPSTSLGELAALFASSALAVTNDTGPMHLAVATGVRTLSLFRTSSATRWRHPVERHRVVQADGKRSEEVVREGIQVLDGWLQTLP